MKLTGPQIISELRDRLSLTMGRHLYVVLGGYGQLEHFEQIDLATATNRNGQPFPAPINLNRRLLDSMDDASLRRLVNEEARYPQAVRSRLNQALHSLLDTLLQVHRLLIIKHVELVFAYGIDLSIFRTAAANQSHLLLLLPGVWQSGRVILFHEANARFHQTLPENLVAENHLWELNDA
jgi:hypothetical protein